MRDLAATIWCISTVQVENACSFVLKMANKIPFHILYECQGHDVVIETITKEAYHGKLLQVETNMNCELQCVSVKYRNGETVEMEHVYIRGSKIVFLVLPSTFIQHPVFAIAKPRPVKPPEHKTKSKKKKPSKGKLCY